MHTIEIRHNFESAHRLPHLEGKCQSIHGHSFWVTATLAAETLDQGIAVEYADAKAYLRGWIDHHWDHGSILGERDPLVEPLMDAGCKVFAFPGWPTVEALAQYLGRDVLASFCRTINLDPDRGTRPVIRVVRVHVQETHVNAASWEV